MSRDYQKTKGSFFLFDPSTEEYYKGLYKGSSQFTKYQWEAHEYKIIGNARKVQEELNNESGSCFVVVDRNGTVQT